MWNCDGTWIRRFVACLLGIASPSRVGMIVAGCDKPPRTWLDRWERRIDMRVVRAFAEDPLLWVADCVRESYDGGRRRIEMKNLIGKHVTRAWMDGDDVYFDCADGAIRLRPEADYDARCFIAGVTLADALTDATVLSIEDLEFSSSGDDTVVDVFGHRIHTTRGTCTFDMRTEHNGYYSGWLNVDVGFSIPPGAKPLEDF